MSLIVAPTMKKAVENFENVKRYHDFIAKNGGEKFMIESKFTKNVMNIKQNRALMYNV